MFRHAQSGGACFTLTTWETLYKGPSLLGEGDKITIKNLFSFVLSDIVVAIQSTFCINASSWIQSITLSFNQILHSLLSKWLGMEQASWQCLPWELCSIADGCKFTFQNVYLEVFKKQPPSFQLPVSEWP